LNAREARLSPDDIGRFSLDDVIEVYKAGIDRTLIRENLKLNTEGRVRRLMELQRVADELQRAGARLPRP
jgi:hypothetical protein